MLVFHTHTCLLIACLYTHCVLAYSPLHIMLAYLPLHITLAYLHLHTLTLAYFALGCFRSSSVCVCKCKCRSVSVQRIFRKNPSQCFREKKKEHCVWMGTNSWRHIAQTCSRTNLGSARASFRAYLGGVPGLGGRDLKAAHPRKPFPGREKGGVRHAARGLQ